MAERFMSSANSCDDMFIRHIGNLKERIDKIRKELINPFTCLSGGIRWIIGLLVNILYWCGFISNKLFYKIVNSWIVKILTITITIIGLISSIVTIVIGWEQFFDIIVKLTGGDV